MNSHDIVLSVAIICIAVIGVFYIRAGGDGVALTGSTTAIAAVLGYKIATGSQPPSEK